MKNKKKQDYLVVKFEKKNSSPQIYYKGEKIIGNGLNDLYLEQLNLNFLTDTEYEHQLELSLSGFQLADNDPTFLTKQFVTSLKSLDEAILKMKKNIKEKEKLKNEDNGKKTK